MIFLIRKPRNPKIRKSGNPEILDRRAWRSLSRNTQPHILQSTSLLGGRHEPEALKSAAPVLASQIERMKGNVCQESLQKFCKALKRSFTGPTSCRPPSADHRTSPASHRGTPHLGAHTYKDFACLHFPQVFACFLRTAKISLNALTSGYQEVLR